MIKSNIAIIELGSSKVVTIIGTIEKNGKISIKGFNDVYSTGILRGTVISVSALSNSIKVSVDAAQIQAGVKIHEAAICLSGSYINLESIKEKVPVDFDINPLQNIQNFDYKKNIFYNEDVIQLSFNGNSNFFPKSSTITENYDFFYSHYLRLISKSIENMTKSLYICNIAPTEFVLKPIAASKVLSETEKETGVLLINIGGGLTTAAYYFQGILKYIFIFYFSGNLITKLIKDEFSILERSSERLKIDHGNACFDPELDDSILIQGIKGRSDKTVQKTTLNMIIQNCIDKFIFQLNNQINMLGLNKHLDSGIVITGGGSLLKNIDKKIWFSTGIKVRIGIPDLDVLIPDVQMNSPKYAASLGLLSLKNQLKIEENF